MQEITADLIRILKEVDQSPQIERIPELSEIAEKIVAGALFDTRKATPLLLKILEQNELVQARTLCAFIIAAAYKNGQQFKEEVKEKLYELLATEKEQMVINAIDHAIEKYRKQMDAKTGFRAPKINSPTPRSLRRKRNHSS